MNTQKEIKRFDKRKADLEIAKLQECLPMALEYKDLLKGLEVETIEDFENQINKQTGFVNTKLSATALGFEDEYKRLLEIESRLKGNLDLDAVSFSRGIIKKSVLDGIKKKHTIYFTDEEIEHRAVLDKVTELYNSLPSRVRNRNYIAFNRSNELKLNPFVRWH